MLFLRSNLRVVALTRMCGSTASRVSNANSKYCYDTLLVSQPSNYVFHVEINRPEKRNAMNEKLWREIGDCFECLGMDSDCRVVVLSAKGKMFTSGIDLADLSNFAGIVTSEDDVARKCKVLKETVSGFQRSMSSLEKCSKPVICAIQNGCLGAGVDLISAGDIRYCSKDAWFQIKEVDLGLAADVGTLQRFPKIIGNESLARELCFTARKFDSDEALKAGFVSKIFPDQPSLIEGALNIATLISEKSPVAVQATKEALVFSRDHTVQEGLDYMAYTNMTFLQSEDVMKSMMAMMNKEKPVFAKL